MALQYARVAAALVLVRRPQVHRARDVGCTAVVLAARVQQQQRGARHGAVIVIVCLCQQVV